MQRRTRALIGTIFLLVFVPAYALVAMALAQANPIREAAPFVQTILFAALGLAWIVPVMPVIKWMGKPDA